MNLFYILWAYYWLLLFVIIMMACQWFSLLFVTLFQTSSIAYCTTKSNHTASLVLGTIILIVAPIIGIIGMKRLVNYLRGDNNDYGTDKGNNGNDDVDDDNQVNNRISTNNINEGTNNV